VPLLLTLKIFNLYYPYFSYCPPFHSTLYYSTPQHFELILGNIYPLLSFSLVPAVTGQVPEPFTTETQLSSPSFKFFPQFGERVFFFEQVAHQ